MAATSVIRLEDLTSTQGFSLSGIDDSKSGFSVSGIGDINGDNISDFMITAPASNSWAGVVYIIYGKNGGIDNINLKDLTPSQCFILIGKSGWTGYSASIVIFFLR